jgi:glycerate dehydrogenase
MASNLCLVLLDTATFGDASLEALTSQWQCRAYPFTPKGSVARRLRHSQVAVVNKVVLDQAILNSTSAKALKLVVVAATGTDNIDLEAARRLDIGVCNVPGYATQAVAQFTMALILELATCAGRYAELVRGGAWERSPVFTVLEYPTVELGGKVLGIVGYGSIGKTVASMARAFGLEVLISARPGSPEPVPHGRVSFQELLRRADFVTLHCPLAPNTRSLMDRHAFGRMKPGAFLVNTSRGGLVDADALLEALGSKRLAGAALDVIDQEPPMADQPLVHAAKDLKTLLITPHCAWGTREARQRLIGEVAENIAAYTRGVRRNRVV